MDIIDETLKIEGGYVYDPVDRGGETYKGISRRAHPDWPGWIIINRYKSISGFEKLLDGNSELQTLVIDLYERVYLEPFKQIPDEAIRAELFDTAVNMGVGRAAMMLQDALNLLNRNGDLYDDLIPDGMIGAKTMAAYSAVKPAVLLKVLNGLQFMRYFEIVEGNPLQEKYFAGWMQRV